MGRKGSAKGLLQAARPQDQDATDAMLKAALDDATEREQMTERVQMDWPTAEHVMELPVQRLAAAVDAQLMSLDSGKQSHRLSPAAAAGLCRAAALLIRNSTLHLAIAVDMATALESFSAQQLAAVQPEDLALVSIGLVHASSEPAFAEALQAAALPHTLAAVKWATEQPPALSLRRGGLKALHLQQLMHKEVAAQLLHITAVAAQQFQDETADKAGRREARRRASLPQPSQLRQVALGLAACLGHKSTSSDAAEVAAILEEAAPALEALVAADSCITTRLEASGTLLDWNKSADKLQQRSAASEQGGQLRIALQKVAAAMSWQPAAAAAGDSADADAAAMAMAAQLLLEEQEVAAMSGKTKHRKQQKKAQKQLRKPQPQGGRK